MLTFDEILKCTKGRLIQGRAPSKIFSVSIDTRTLSRQALYVAIKGKIHDGHRFCPQAQRAKAAAVMVSKKVKNCSLPMILVKDTTRALGDLAAAYRQTFSIPIIAITGSAGKTTTKDLIAGVLAKKYRVLKTEKNLNNQYGLPLMLLKLKPHHQAAVLELGINQKGDMGYLAKIVRPTIAVFTNIGPSHLQGLKSLRGIVEEKTKLIRSLAKGGLVVYNADDAYLSKYCTGRKRVRFGIHHPCRFQAKNIQSKGSKQLFQVNNKPFSVKGLGNHYIYNALSAILCGYTLKVSYNKINTSLRTFNPEHNRGSWEKCGSIWLLNDTYNANPISFTAALNALTQRKGQGQRVVVCADMLELGPKEKEYHKALARQFSRALIDYVFTFGKLARTTYSHLPKDVEGYHFSNRARLHQKLKTHLKPGDMVLVKGSRGMEMEKTVNFIRKTFSA